MKAFVVRMILRLDQWDRALSRRIAHAETGGRSLHFVTHLGDGWLWALLSLLPVGRGRDKVGWGASLVGAALMTLSIKRTVRRSRPRTLAGLYSQSIDQFSFPSGHGARLGVICVWVLRLRPQLFAPTALYALLIGWSRVRLGIHTVGDVMVGYGVGALVGWMGLWLARGRTDQSHRKRKGIEPM